MAKMFDVRVKTKKGIESFKVNANNSKEAQKMMSSKGRVVGAKETYSGMMGRSLSRADRIVILRRLAMMTRSRVSLTLALNTINTSFSGKISQVAKILEQKIQSGDNLIEAMNSIPADFPATTVSLVRSGMHGGELHQALQDAADFEFEMHQIGKGAKKGIMGAGFEFIVASILIIITAYWVGPWVLDSKMMKMAGDSVNIDWAFLLADILAFFIVLILTSLTFLILVAYVFKPFAPELSDKIVLKIPVFRDLVLSKTYYSVFYGLSLLIRSGVRLQESLILSSNNAPPGAVRMDLKNAAESLAVGQIWSRKMINLHPTDRACLETAQDKSELSDAFLVVAMSHRLNYATRVDQLLPTLSVVSNLFMAMAGVLIFAMMMLPNLQLTRGIL